MEVGDLTCARDGATMTLVVIRGGRIGYLGARSRAHGAMLREGERASAELRRGERGQSLDVRLSAKSKKGLGTYMHLLVIYKLALRNPFCEHLFYA